MKSLLAGRSTRAYTDPIPVLAGNTVDRITDFYLFGATLTACRLGTDLTATTELFAQFVSAYNGKDEAGRNCYVQTALGLPIASEQLTRDCRFSYGDNQRPINGVMHGIIPGMVQFNRPKNPNLYESEAHLHDSSASSGMVYLGIRNPEVTIVGRKRRSGHPAPHYVTSVEYLMLSSTGEIFLM